MLRKRKRKKSKKGLKSSFRRAKKLLRGRLERISVPKQQLTQEEPGKEKKKLTKVLLNSSQLW